MSEYGVLLFHSTSAALKAERALLRAGLTLKLIPTPREFSSDCGLALRFDWSQAEIVRAGLAAARVEAADIQRMA